MSPQTSRAGLREGGAPLQIGAVAKHYEIIRKLGQGGMGAVFLARDTKLGRLVAVKVLLDRSGEGARRFLVEARATARCRHENIVVIHEVDEIDGAPYMVLEHLEGRTLRAWMDQRAQEGAPGPLPPSLAVELVVPVVRALGCAHERGIVHRDLKPENIFLTDAGPIKVLDFGVAKQLGAQEIARLTGARQTPHADPGITEEGTLQGTLPYMSPEQWRSEGVDPRSDLWAVGVILHELCAGAHPFAPFVTERLAETADLDHPMPSVTSARTDLGPLAAVIDRCLKKHADQRFGSAEELLAALEPLLPGPRALPLSEDESPFAGLSAFQEADAARFFGREREIAAATGRLRQQPLVAVTGPSGAGKSSFVRAGVIPALKRSGEPWETFTVRPGRAPLAALADVLGNASDPARLAAILRHEPGRLGAELRARCRRQGARHRVLLFVDQLEELYTLGTPPDERAAFVACLAGVADDASSPLRVVLSIRSDFLDRMSEDRALMTEVTRGLSFLPPLDRDGLHAALTRPVEAAGHRFESEDIVEGMLAVLAETRCPLPLLQFTAARLWAARDRDRRLLTRSSYDTLGGVAGALSRHADAVLAGLSPVEGRLCRAVLLRLCTPERTRAVVSLDELRGLADDGAAVELVIQRLTDARLLLVEPGSAREGATVELVHESLIERWTALRRWLDESEHDAQFLARLRAAAQQWEASGEAEGLLWRDRAADDAGAWLERRRTEATTGSTERLGKREERFLLAVVGLSDRARRARRRITAGVIAALAAIAMVVSYLALRADRAAAVARTEAAQARNATRVAAARELEDDPTTALAILREIEPPGGPRGWGELAFGALHDRISSAVMMHPDQANRAAWSPDGRRIVTAAGKAVRVWSADGQGEPLVLHGHEASVGLAVFDPGGKRIATSSLDRTARIWNADGSGAPLTLRGHDGDVYSVAWSPDGTRVVTASADRTARIWNADGSGTAVVLRGHDNIVFSAAWSPDGKHIATGSWDKTVRVWNADGSPTPITLRGHDGEIYSVAWSPDGRRLVTASEDRTVRVWSADGRGEPLVLRGHEGEVYSAVFDPGGARIVTSSEDKTARVWSADGSGAPRILRGHRHMIFSAAWSPDGRRVVTASWDKTTRVWSVDAKGEPLVLRDHEGVVASAAWSPDGRRIVTSSHDRTARVWSAGGAEKPLVLRGHEGWLLCAAWSPDGDRIVTASEDGTARVWSADGKAEPLVLRGHEGRLNWAAWSPDGRRIVTVSNDRTARVWNADGSGAPLVLRGHEGIVNGVGWSPDGRRVVTASYDDTARVWNADGSGEPIVLRGHEGWCLSAAFDADGKRIVTASADRTARVWSADGSGAPTVLRGHEGAVYSAAFGPDRRRVVTASYDKTVRVWSADGSGEPLVLRGHEGFVTSASWSPDGRRIVTASNDRTARIWTDLTPVRSAGAPSLWTATRYCVDAERRVELLGVSPATARADEQACRRRVEEARAAGGEHD